MTSVSIVHRGGIVHSSNIVQCMKMTWMEAKLFLREPIGAFFTLVFPLMMLFLFGTIYGNTPRRDPAARERSKRSFRLLPPWSSGWLD